jgi:poly(hydroxyalkanoate) granule-associated protein
MPTATKVKEPMQEPKESSQTQMAGLMRKMMLATIGAAAIAQEEIEALVNRLIERGEIAEKDGKSMINEMKDKRKNRTMKLEEDISRNITDVLERMNIPSKADVDSLSIKITALSKKIDDLKTPKAPAP